MWPTLIERGKAQCQEVALAETFQCGRRSLSAGSRRQSQGGQPACLNAADALYAPEGEDGEEWSSAPVLMWPTLIKRRKMHANMSELLVLFQCGRRSFSAGSSTR